jgi:hypothetical protein
MRLTARARARMPLAATIVVLLTFHEPSEVVARV